MPRFPRLLVVDDEPYVGSALQRLFRRRFEVVVVQSVDRALEVLEQVDVILCDLKMPDRGGVELYADLSRNHPELVERVVFMTGDLCCQDTAEFLDRIPNQRFEKPFDTGHVQDVLARVAALQVA